MSDLIIAACDGAAKKNPGPAAWGWVIADADGTPQRWEAGPLGVATNNVAELTALAELLEATEPSVPLEVRMDSTYAMQAVTTWIKNWKRNGWLTASKKPVANRELVIRIDELLTGRDVTFRHVAAHRADGDLLNAIADIAASDAAESQQPAGTAHGMTEIPEPRADRVTAEPSARKAAPRKNAGSGKSAGGGKNTGSGKKAPVINAKFAGRCSCGKSYDAGEKITKLASGGWGHVACAQA
ncbi:ribonuclease H family protein [Streptomyces indicus]|uniref:Ribonuclease H n=1 Tax=Streptomyces indicus TaxID=417292 RepID=A0A1G8U201_9ACTN|nr:ribonuclease H [Streptomyces indicus]SDJ47654.1 ribonuclease HI [Streptomyces indicus]